MTGKFMVRDGQLTRDGERFVVLGVNYHPSRTATSMWRDWDRAEIRRDLAAIAASGFNTVRLFLYWRDLQPTEAGPDGPTLRHVRQCVQDAASHGLACVLSLLTIWMNGERLELPWRRGRSIWRDPRLLDAQERYVEAVVAAVADCAGLLAVDLGDEISNVDATDATSLSAGELRAWYGRLRDAARRAAPHVLVCQANDATAVFGGTAFTVANAGPLDLNAVHGFPSWSPGAIESSVAVKATNLAPFLASVAGAYRPALIDELGCYGAGERTAARYLGAAAASALANGALGVIVWCWQDIAFTGAPFDSRPLERFVGLHRLDGSPRPTMVELSRVLTRADALYRRGRARIALYLPERVCGGDHSYLDPSGDAIASFYAYLLLKRAHLDFDVVAGDLVDYQLVFCPSARQLTSRDLARFERLTTQGGTLYVSVGHHLHGFPGADLAGVEPVDYSLLPDGRDRIVWDGDHWPLAWTPAALPLLSVEPLGARVVGHFPDGAAALVHHRVGTGQVVLCTAPYELQIDGAGRLEAWPWHTLYERVAELAGMLPDVRCDQPDVEVVPLDRDRSVTVLVVNHRPVPVATTVSWPSLGRRAELTMAAKQWRILHEREGA